MAVLNPSYYGVPSIGNDETLISETFGFAGTPAERADLAGKFVSYDATNSTDDRMFVKAMTQADIDNGVAVIGIATVTDLNTTLASNCITVTKRGTAVPVQMSGGNPLTAGTELIYVNGSGQVTANATGTKQIGGFCRSTTTKVLGPDIAANNAYIDLLTTV